MLRNKTYNRRKLIIIFSVVMAILLSLAGIPYGILFRILWTESRGSA